jgi:hypothetical protein
LEDCVFFPIRWRWIVCFLWVTWVSNRSGFRLEIFGAGRRAGGGGGEEGRKPGGASVKGADGPPLLVRRILDLLLHIRLLARIFRPDPAGSGEPAPRLGVAHGYVFYNAGVIVWRWYFRGNNLGLKGRIERGWVARLMKLSAKTQCYTGPVVNPGPYDGC